MNESSPSKSRSMLLLAGVLGVLVFITLLASYHIADGDLWGKLAIGAHVWQYGTVPDKDTFAFTPVLPHYIEHEWGAGTIFYGVLRFFGGQGLMVLKILLALGAMATALATGRRLGASWNALLVLAIPATAAILPGYIPVIRSHAFTYCFFGLTLFALEELRAGKSWPAAVLPAVMFLWSNIHGGFVAGLGAIGVYTIFALVSRRRAVGAVVLAFSCALVTFLNIYGLKFWPYLIPALLHKRPRITEWQPLPLLGNDPFLGFRILFVLVLVLVLATWKRTQKKSCAGMVMLGITAVLAWRSRRHAPFFGVASLAFTGPFLETALKDIGSKLSVGFRERFQPAFALLVLYGLFALYAAEAFLPNASFTVLAPVGHDPVREADILSLAKVEGNCATPFGWGCYATWRLYPKIKGLHGRPLRNHLPRIHVRDERRLL